MFGKKPTASSGRRRSKEIRHNERDMVGVSSIQHGMLACMPFLFWLTEVGPKLHADSFESAELCLGPLQ